MKLAPKTKYLIEDFFRHYFSDENFSLPEINVYSGKFSKLIATLLNIDGITIGRHILIRPSLIYKNQHNQFCMQKKLLVHEITHVIQYEQQGFFKFLFNYFREYFGNLTKKNKWGFASRMQAYLNISFEVEARNSASEFMNWFNR